jgi:hypothetical protein
MKTQSKRKVRFIITNCLSVILFAYVVFSNEGGRPTPGKTYFPISTSDWVFMAKYHNDFSDSQKTRAAYQAIAMKLDEVCNCNVVGKVNSVSNNGGRFWEEAWKVWSNNFIENQKVLDVIINSIDSLNIKTNLKALDDNKKSLFNSW